MIANPITGEVLPDDLPTLVRAERMVDAFLRSMHPHYSFRRALRERIAELRGPAELPRPRFRTETQQRVASCARCGSKPGSKAKASPNGTGEHVAVLEAEAPVVVGLS